MNNAIGTSFARHATNQILTALQDTPVVLVNGPRQSGKTTLVQMLGGASHPYVTLDDDTVLAAARGDPAGFVRGLEHAIIDEVQRAPELLRAIKKKVDEDRRPGQFLLTGSCNILTLPQIADSLAGRMAVIDLLPLSRTEILGVAPTFLQQAFEGRVSQPVDPCIGMDLVDVVLTGGYPEMLRRSEPRRRQAWARDYINAITQRDVRDVAHIDKLEHLPRMLRTLAQHSGQLANFTQIGAQLGLNDKTARKYVAVFEQLFLIRSVLPWFDNALKRLVKTPKLHFLDTGLLAVLRGMTAARVAADRTSFGPVLENFVYAEICKLASWHPDACVLYHYRDKDQDEVDIVVESDAGTIVGIEVKAAASVNAADFTGMRKLAAASNKRFAAGMVLYDGDRIVPFGDRLFAAPLSCLWT